MTTTQFKFKLTAIHFALCAAIAVCMFLGFWFIWYPHRLFYAVGGAEVFAIVVAVDLVIGPLLTFVVAKPNKSSLRFDLAVIAALQLAALVYGAFALWSGRPAYIASLGHRFDVVTANDIQQTDFDPSKLPIWGPQWVSIQKPSDPKERETMLMSGVFGADYGHYPKYHIPLEAESPERLKNSEPISALNALNPGREADIVNWLSTHGATPETARFQGLKARKEDMTVFLDAKGRVLGIGAFRPWKD